MYSEGKKRHHSTDRPITFNTRLYFFFVCNLNLTVSQSLWLVAKQKPYQMSYTLHKKKTTHTHTYRIEASGTILYIFDIHMRLLVFYSHYSTETNFTIVNIVEFCATYNILHLFLTRHSNREYHNSYPLHVLPLYILARHEMCKKMRKKERKKTNNGLHEMYSVCVPLLTSLLAIRQTH